MQIVFILENIQKKQNLIIRYRARCKSIWCHSEGIERAI